MADTTEDTSGPLNTLMDIKGVGKVPLRTAIGPEILKNIQDLIDQREAPQKGILSPLLEGFKDASAYVSRDPTAAIARDAEKRAQQTDLASMRMQLGTLKSAAAQRAQDSAFMRGKGQAGENGQPVGGQQVSTDRAQEMVNSLPDSLKGSGQLLANNGEWDALTKMVKDIENHRTVLSKDLELLKDTPPGPFRDKLQAQILDKSMGVFTTVGPNGESIKYSLNGPTDPNKTPTGSSVVTPAAGISSAGGNSAAALNNPTGIGYDKAKNTWTKYDSPEAGVRAHMEQSKRYLSGLGPMAGIPATPENYVGMWVNGKPATGATEQNGTYAADMRKELKNAGVELNKDGTIPNTPEALRAIARAQINHEAGPQDRERFLNVVNGVKTAPGVNAAPAAAPLQGGVTAPVTPVPFKSDSTGMANPWKPGSDQYIEVQNKNLEQQREIAKEQEKARTEINKAEPIEDIKAGIKRKEKLDTQFSKVDSTIEAANSVIDENKKHPRAYGLGIEGNALVRNASAFSDIILPKEKAGAGENLIASNMLSQAERESRNETNTRSKQLGIDYAAQEFQGARMGIGLERLAADAKGVDVRNPASQNIAHAAVIGALAQYAKLAKPAYIEYQKTHPDATWGKFEASEDNQKLYKQAREEFVKRHSDVLSVNKDGEIVVTGTRTTNSNIKFPNDPEKQARFEAYVKNKGNK